jgi:arylsulfatase A-like enzyme
MNTLQIKNYISGYWKKSIAASSVIIGSQAMQITTAQTDVPQAYNGTIGRTLAESKPGTPKFKTAPRNAPNVVWILIDDVGFGASSAFGGLIQTPTFDSLANNGLRYANFHTEAYSAPTRAALLTGRNHHSVHMGLFTECAQEYPGYDGRIPFEKGSAAAVLKENGYNTLAVGKWHVTPVKDATQAGPFNRWPTGLGFEKYYGFLFGETDQYTPQMWENTDKIDPDLKGKTFNASIADKAIQYIANQKSAAPDKPFFLYYAPGATHAPHQVPRVWADRYKGKFDKGWDWYRNEVLKNQKKLGIVPANAELPKRNPGVAPWDSLSHDEKKVYARLFENYAGFLSETDYEIGRVINYIKQIGQLDNTAVFVIIGDNGASGEGTETGIIQGFNERLSKQEHVKFLLDNIDRIGTEDSKDHYPTGWAQATSTPFRLSKGYANAEGGTHNPLIVFWPQGIKEKGGIRNQYSHVIDLLPTTIELTHTEIPAVINGYKQDSIEGYSFFSSLNDAKSISKHNVQYYEVVSRRAFYKDGKFQVATNSNKKIVHLESYKPIPLGKVKLRLDFTYTNPSNASDPAGTEKIYINGEKVGELPIAKYQADISAYDEGIDVGKDLNTPVSDRYTSPFEFTGTLNSVTIEYTDNKTSK